MADDFCTGARDQHRYVGRVHGHAARHSGRRRSFGRIFERRIPGKADGPVSDPKLRAALKLIAARQYTSLGDATTAARMMELSHRYGAHTNIRYSRHISVREFKTGN